MPKPSVRPKHLLVWVAFLGVVALLTTDLICGQLRRDESPETDASAKAGPGLFARDNLTAWCIVPFDSRNRDPGARAAMLEKLGFKHFAYDWRAEHVPSFDAEVEALKRHGVELTAFWGPAALNDDSRRILDLLKRHHVKAQLWVMGDEGPDKAEGDEQERRVADAAAKVEPLARAAAEIGCTVALYNHGGWFGEPENQIAIIERLKKDGVDNVGIVYNLHHGHDHLDRFPALLKTMMPYLMALNINGMDADGDRNGRKILPLGQGEEDLKLLRIIRDSGYKGRIGILGHTQDDAEERLLDNLDGLDWLVPQLDGAAPGPRPTPRTPVPPRPVDSAGLSPAQAGEVAGILASARTQGDPARGAVVFADVRHTCLACHKVGDQGGTIGPDLTSLSKARTPEEIVASVLWPRLKVEPEYQAFGFALDDGRVVQGYKQGETDDAVRVRDATLGEVVTLPRDEIVESRPLGTLMPEGLTAATSPGERNDLFAFLLTLGADGVATPALGAPGHAHAHPSAPAEFEYDRKPLRPEFYASADDHVNRHRTFDFYAKEADHFRALAAPPPLLPMYPGLDGGKSGHWGNQNETTWADGRWNESDVGSMQSGVLHVDEKTAIPKAVCLRLGDKGELSVCFDPETLTYPVLWTDGFLEFSSVRHGFLNGLTVRGKLLPRPEGEPPTKPFKYQGFYRNGKRVVFAYSIDGEDWLDAPWVDERGAFVRQAGPAATHPLRELTRGGPSQWPQTFTTRGKRSETRPFAIDVIEPPFENPWKSLMFFGGLDFLPDGTAIVATMEGDVWRVSGIDDALEKVVWRRFATGLHQPQGVLVAEGSIYVAGRDQITELKDLDGDGEADFYRCVNNAYLTSTAGHDFVCGLQRDADGNFYTASGPQGILRVPPDGGPPTVLATGFRNPDGIGLTRSGILSAPQSEGNWVPTSQVVDVAVGGHYGYPGPRNDEVPSLPLVYLPRGIDNSSAEQIEITSDRWGPFQGNRIHLSYGAASTFLLLRDVVDGQPQGAVWPIPGDYLSGIHRGRFNPVDGQLYVVGQAGWGTYSSLDGCFQRLRYTGDPIQAPRSIHVVENGVVLGFNLPIDPSSAARPGACFAQAWNYRYSASYGSLEHSTIHPGAIGHDVLPIRGVHVVGDGRTLFLEIPDVQPVDTLHLRLDLGDGWPQELFATVHKLAPPFTDFPGYRPSRKIVAAHPRLADMVALQYKKVPNPWAAKLPKARGIKMVAGKNLTFATPAFKVKAGETIRLTFVNPDVVPHNWVLLRPGTQATVGDLVNKIIAEPDAAIRGYVPRTDDVLVYTDITEPGASSSIDFKAPDSPGRYPFLCSFPGHWMVMNGVMTVE